MRIENNKKWMYTCGVMRTQHCFWPMSKVAAIDPFQWSKGYIPVVKFYHFKESKRLALMITGPSRGGGIKLEERMQAFVSKVTGYDPSSLSGRRNFP